MATFYLLNTTIVGSKEKFLAGRLMNDAVDPVADVRAAGGVLWPSADTDVAAAAAIAAKAMKKGQNEDFLDKIMGAALARSLVNGNTEVASLMALADAGSFFATKTVEAALQSLAAGTAGNGKGILTASKAIGFADLNALGGVMTGTIAFAAALPASARFMGALWSVTTKFQNAGDTATLDSDLGDGTTPDLYIGDADLHTTGEKFAGDAGGKQFQNAAAVTPTLTFTCSVNLSTLSAGAGVAKLFYAIIP
jgi:hypothetical protein